LKTLELECCELGAKLSVFSSSVPDKVEMEGGCWQNQ